jgi:putative hydrolase of the HAD superfamily
MGKSNFLSSIIVCVGDKCDDELLTGKTLGMIIVMFEHGRHYKTYLKETHKQIKPDYSIKHIQELLGWQND